MKQKAKLVATLMSMCLVLSFAVIGILAVKTLNMSVGGNITFNASGVSFTVGEGKFYKTDKTTLYSGITTQTGKMVGFKVDTNTTLESLSDEIATWAGLELKLDSQGDAVLKFNIKNDMSSTELKVGFAVTLGTNKNNNMNIVAPTLETIAGGANKDIYITFDILDDTINAGLTGFKIAITIGDQNGAAAAPNLEVDASSGAVTNTTLTKYTNAKYNISDATNKCVSVFESGKNVSGEVIIADKVYIDGVEYAVTAIRVGSFENCTGITKITIPSTITSIGGGTFSGCTALEEVIIPDSITLLGTSVFTGCTKLTTVVIGNGLATLSDGSFANCPAIESITIYAENPPAYDGPEPFMGSTCPIYVPSGSVSKYQSARGWSFISSRIQAIPA